MKKTTSQQPLPLPTKDPKEAYKHIRNYLAGRLVGATRDETLVDEVIKCLFSRALLNQKKVGSPSDPLELSKQYRSAFGELRKMLPDVFFKQDEILLDPTSIKVVDSHISSIDFDNPIADPIGDAYEAFVGSSIRGSAGQFFTPQNAVRLLVNLVDPQPGEKIIDPACGAGGFLSYTARHLFSKGTSRDEVANSVFGIDKDQYLCHLATAHVGMVTFSPAQIHCADSLAWEAGNGNSFGLKENLNYFDVVLTNPPFGSKIVAASDEVLRNFDLGYRWKAKKGESFEKTNQINTSVSPQILFIERCLSLVKPGGRIGIVVPESMLSGKSYRYVVQYIREHAEIDAVVGMPEALFKTSGKGGTHTKTCLVMFHKKPAKSKSNGKSIFMAETHWCGHDSRGRDIGKDDLPLVRDRYNLFVKGSMKGHSNLGYSLASKDLTDNVLAPRYYNPEISEQLETLQDTHELISIKEFVDAGILSVSTGDEVGKMAYGTGEIPFVRTSDISNWEIKLDPKHLVDQSIYNSLSRKQDVKEGDILMVRDGTYLIGTCAYVTKYDTKMVYQSHLYKLRCNDHNKLSPFLLLAALSSPPVQAQIKAKRFTQDIIDSLGDRLYELVLPLPRSLKDRDNITKMVKKSIDERVEARELARHASYAIIGVSPEEINGRSVQVS